MGWFRNQIEERAAADRKSLEESIEKASGKVLDSGKADRYKDIGAITSAEFQELLRYFSIRSDDAIVETESLGEQLEHSIKTRGLLYRSIELGKGWHNDTIGLILAFRKEDDKPCLLIPRALYGYSFIDEQSGRRVNVNAKIAETFKDEALCFYDSLPEKSLTTHDLLHYIKSKISSADYIFIALVTFAVTAAGLLLPQMTKLITGPVFQSGDINALAVAGISVVCVLFSRQLFSAAQNLMVKRLEMKGSVPVRSAMMIRLLSLPVSFFRNYSPGELKTRIAAVDRLCLLILNMTVDALLTLALSLLYLVQIYFFVPRLLVPSLIVILLGFAVMTPASVMQSVVSRKEHEFAAKESGLSYALIGGVQKLKLSGSEKRAFAKWLDAYSDKAACLYNPPTLVKVRGTLYTALALFGNIAFYYIAGSTDTDASSFYAFTTAFAMLFAAFTQLADTSAQMSEIRPILEMSAPLLAAVPEKNSGNEKVESLSGAVSLKDLSFRYSDDSEYVLKDISLDIKPGEYIALVGKTGCGKSTLMRLLLGFEKADKGSIFYDGRDINSLDPTSLRHRIGCVMQNDSLFQGNLYSNITISAPEASLEDAWEAAEKSGIADDIRSMPMGMYTYISEGHGGISSGQKQKLLAARALVSKPDILIFDEATSALDNISQKHITDALDSIGCTRIVIAHRLSTIQSCGRILVLDKGVIAEDGTYDELMAENGIFADLVRNQQV